MSVDSGNDFVIIRHQNDIVGELFSDRSGSNDLILWDNRNGSSLNFASHSLSQYNSEIDRLAESEVFGSYPVSQIFSIFIANKWQGFNGNMPSTPAQFHNFLGALPSDFVDARPTSGPVKIDGYGGGDTIHGSNFGDQLAGNTGRDIIFGEGGDDQIFGGSQNDDLRGQGGADEIFGGRDDDLIYGGDGDDVLHGEHGFDVLRGEDNNDSLFGGTGNDTLIGDQGNDLLVGQEGSDTLVGGPGSDRFILDETSLLVNAQLERISDYNQGNTGSFDIMKVMSLTFPAFVAVAGGTGQAANLLWRVESENGSTI